jgi:hypothetical protein
MELTIQKRRFMKNYNRPEILKLLVKNLIDYNKNGDNVKLPKKVKSQVKSRIEE